GVKPILINAKVMKPYVFKASDLKHVNLTKLVSDAKAARKKGYYESSLVDLAKAAELLHLDNDAVRGLVENGFLWPCKAGSDKKAEAREYYISLRAIKKYENLGIDCTSLVSLSVAARTVGLSLGRFYERYKRTGVLAIVTVGRNSYYRKQDVEKLVALRRR